MQKLGGMGGVLGMLPGVGKIKKQLDTAKLDDDDPEAPAGDHRLDDASPSARTRSCSMPRARSAWRAGSGTSVQDINKLVKMHRQMADMMKAMGKKRGLLGQLFGGGPPPELPADLPPARRCLQACRHCRQAAFPALPADFRAAFPVSQACRAAFPACQDRRNDDRENEAEG